MSPLLTKFFYSTKFNEHVKIVRQPELNFNRCFKSDKLVLGFQFYK